MKNSGQIVRDAIEGRRPARTPIYDILTNDAVIERFSGLPLDGADDRAAVLGAIGTALDCTRYLQLPFTPGAQWVDEGGNLREAARWTQWVKRHAFAEQSQWLAWMEGEIEAMEAATTPGEEERRASRAAQAALNAELGGSVYIHCTPSTAINEALFAQPHGLGIEQFSYLWADEEQTLRRWLRAISKRNLLLIEREAHAETSPLAIIYSDIAFKERLMFGRDMLGAFGFFEDLEAICAACHGKGLTVVFHSDGYIMDILEDLLACGVDGLNPIEKAAGMDIYEIRRRRPGLLILGGVDVTHLLPEGSPDEIRRETRRLMREIGSEGRFLIGSSTELDATVSLENYLAFRDAVMEG
jgi:hypothetical protein